MSNFYKQAYGAMVTSKERELLKALAEKSCERYDQPVIVNIGVFCACTMHCFRAGCERAILIGVDNDYKTRQIERKNELNAIFIEGDSREVHREFEVTVKDEEHGILYKTDKVDLLLFDGDHRYLTVKRDVEGWTPHVSVNGIIAFHDYNVKEENIKWDPALPGVRKAVDEWFSVNNLYWRELEGADSIRVFQRSYTGD